MRKLVDTFITILMLLSYSILCAQTNSGELPAWLFKAENYNRINTYIGVSNPGMDTSAALQQAKYNALLVNSLLHDAKFTSLTSVGFANQQENKNGSSTVEYILYTAIIKGTIPSINRLKINNKQFTTYKEAVLLGEFDDEQSEEEGKLEYSLIRRAAFQKEDTGFPLFLDELEFDIKQDDSLVYSYAIEKKGMNIIEREKNAVKLFFEENTQSRKNFFYPDLVNYSNTNELIPSLPYPLHNGFWNAFIFNLVDQVCIYNSMDINLQFKLSTLNLANQASETQGLSFQQLVYSLKNVHSISLNNRISGIDISGNDIRFAVFGKEENIKEEPFSYKLNKSEKKMIKKLKTENWQYLGSKKNEDAWISAWQKTRDKDYLSVEIEIKNNNLQSGILEGMQLAKLHLSSMMASHVSNMSKVELNQGNTAVKAAKLINIEKTGSLGPYYIFYQRVGNQLFNIKLFVCYHLTQLKE